MICPTCGQENPEEEARLIERNIADRFKRLIDVMASLGSG
jgi:hypothetical protein